MNGQRNIINLKKAILNWSGGKDCAFALHLFRQQHPETEIKLCTSVNENTGRVSMHGLRHELTSNQAAALGLEIEKVFLPEMPDNATYEKLMGNKFQELKTQGFEISVFGDIFLEDIRQYREKQMARAGLQTGFPLWNKNTNEIAKDFIESGFRAVIIATGDEYFGPETIGVEYDEQFISGLPYGVDPCGENGEFHTFVYDGPGFKVPVKFLKSKVVRKSYASPVDPGRRTGFRFMELLPA